MEPPRILVVDDDAESLSILRRLLVSEGYQAILAPDGMTALAEVSRRAPDVVLTDVNMPAMDGLELTRRLHAVDPDIPVIVTTGVEGADAAVGSLRAGAIEFLTKPIDVDALLRAVRQAIALHAAKVERDQLHARAEQLYRQAQTAIGTYERVLGVIGHDLRALLGIINVAVDGSRSGDGTLPPRLEVVPRVVTRMKLILDNLVDEARLQSGTIAIDPSLHAVDEILGDVEDLRAIALSRNVSLEIERRDEGVTLWCDRQRIGQVLANLVSNAVRFSPKGATVRVAAASGGDGMVAFEVTDSGPGIAPEALPHIFGRFWQARAHGHDGLGLGLFIANGITEAHRGRIEVESEVGRGTTFRVILPSASPPA